MAACPEYEVLLDVFAAGALETEEAARVHAHVKSCDGCREAIAETVGVLGMVELPPLTPEEKATVQELPQRTLAAWRRNEQHRGLRRRTLYSLVAAAAVVALMLLVPGLIRNPGEGGGTVTAPVTSEADSPTGDEVDAETMAAIEAWAGLEPLDEDVDALEDGDALDEDLDFELGETL
ncbi:zf-HC2 domain-containing protein [Pyxidicoccus trucidator]|uniref:zf-HC2 domain-containing protein n=1 Tax=Pyxidicoccus trucidator TaxID=2709662 RepID=UPI0013D9B724|nr:zf-HC2 domain-containing protein [Pyxidicoccus trucidator]